MNLELITTKDGSHTIFVPELNERYHSIHGAIQESIHVFINAGLNYFITRPHPNPLLKKGEGELINIFEVGLGTGLNCILTFIEAEKLNLKINYTSIEAFPVSLEMANQLNYSQLINSNLSLDIIFQKIHTSAWNKKNSLSDNFNLEKINNTLQQVVLKNNFDIIYFDAFAPTVQPELWTEEIFKKLFDSLNPNGILVTYCAKGEVKRTLKKVGFKIESIQGPPGKREMIRAMVTDNESLRIY